MTNKLALLVAVLLAGLAIYGVVQYVEKQKRELFKEAKQVAVAILAKDARSGDELNDDMVERVQINERDLRYMKHVVLWDKWTNYKNHEFATDVDKGQFLRDTHFPTIRSAPSLNLADGERAITIPVDKIVGLSGMLKPGDYVDVLANFESEGDDMQFGDYVVNFQQFTLFLCKKREVLALDNRRDPGAAYPNYRTITLRVTKAEAQKISFSIAFSKGIQLSLRNDTEEVEPKEPKALDNIDVHFLGLEGKPYKPIQKNR